MILERGTKVILGLGVKHREFSGAEGVIVKYIKCRNSYDVRLKDGRLYEAYAANVLLEALRVEEI